MKKTKTPERKTSLKRARLAFVAQVLAGGGAGPSKPEPRAYSSREASREKAREAAREQLGREGGDEAIAHLECALASLRAEDAARVNESKRQAIRNALEAVRGTSPPDLIHLLEQEDRRLGRRDPAPAEVYFASYAEGVADNAQRTRFARMILERWPALAKLHPRAWALFAIGSGMEKEAHGSSAWTAKNEFRARCSSWRGARETAARGQSQTRRPRGGPPGRA